MYAEAQKAKQILQSAETIVIVQADNPDADSLGSALALEHILGDLGKTPVLYCGVDMPTYLRYMPGWDRVQAELPPDFDASIIVDASTMTLLERLSGAGYHTRLAAKPAIVLDHHEVVDNPVPFASITINDPGRSSTGELIYILANDFGWPVSLHAQQAIMTSILGDTQGLTNQLATAETYHIMSKMISAGVDRPAIEEARRELGKMHPEIYLYKADLIKRTRFSADGRIASVVVAQTEITKYSPLYNPAPLIQGDMLQTLGVQVAIVFKSYDDGKITAAIRCNQDAPVGGALAGLFGGGGHPYASGFKITDGRRIDEVTAEAIEHATNLLDDLNRS